MKLLAMSGLVPEQICEIVRFRGYEGENRIPHFCGYASDYISMVQREGDLDGAVFPRSCDSSRTIKSYLSGCGKFVYQLHVPARQDAAAVDFFAEALKDYKRALEDYFQMTVSESRIRERAERIAARNRKLGALYESLDGISYSEYIRMVHGMLERPLAEQEVPDMPGRETSGGKRVFLAGSFLADEAVTDTVERSGMKIVGDSLPESGRLCSMPEVSPEGDLFRGIAAAVLKNRLSPTQDNFRRILAADLAEMERKAVQGVLFVTQKYCEPYDYLFYVYKKALDEKGIPVLKLSLSGSQEDRKTDLAVEAFADLL